MQYVCYTRCAVLKLPLESPTLLNHVAGFCQLSATGSEPARNVVVSAVCPARLHASFDDFIPVIHPIPGDRHFGSCMSVRYTLCQRAIIQFTSMELGWDGIIRDPRQWFTVHSSDPYTARVGIRWVTGSGPKCSNYRGRGSRWGTHPPWVRSRPVRYW